MTVICFSICKPVMKTTGNWRIIRKNCSADNKKIK